MDQAQFVWTSRISVTSTPRSVASPWSGTQSQDEKAFRLTTLSSSFHRGAPSSLVRQPQWHHETGSPHMKHRRPSQATATGEVMPSCRPGLSGPSLPLSIREHCLVSRSLFVVSMQKRLVTTESEQAQLIYLRTVMALPHIK